MVLPALRRQREAVRLHSALVIQRSAVNRQLAAGKQLSAALVSDVAAGQRQRCCALNQAAVAQVAVQRQRAGHQLALILSAIGLQGNRLLTQQAAAVIEVFGLQLCIACAERVAAVLPPVRLNLQLPALQQPRVSEIDGVDIEQARAEQRTGVVEAIATGFNAVAALQRAAVGQLCGIHREIAGRYLALIIELLLAQLQRGVGQQQATLQVTQAVVAGVQAGGVDFPGIAQTIAAQRQVGGAVNKAAVGQFRQVERKAVTGTQRAAGKVVEPVAAQ